MTENEAKEYMEDEIRCIQRATYCDRDCAKCPLVKEEKPLLEAFGMAVFALEEIQQYRAIGTVEQLKTLQEDYWKLNEISKEYSAIGTVEQCRNAVNLIRLRKPYKRSFGVFICSLCGEKVGQAVTKTEKTGCMNFCANCGSMVDWSE